MNDARERLRKAGYADLLARLDRARRMNPAKLTHEQVNQRIGQIMDGYHTLVVPAQMSGLYRARKNVGDVPWQFASDLWYPPATAVRNRGRFNDPGSPVLYACNTATGAVFEIRPNVGDVITILIARAKSKVVELACAHIGLERSLAPELGVAPGRIAR